MSYLELITSFLEKNAASSELVVLVADYLDHAHASDEPPWSVEFDETIQAALAYANSKRFRLRRFQKALKARRAQALGLEAGAIRRALKGGNSTKKARQTMISRLELLEQEIKTSKTEAK